MKNRKQKIRLGVFGASRGWSFMSNAQSAGMEVVAVCDQNEALREKAKKEFHLSAYAEFDDLLAHDIDAVVLANYFHQHAPYAIRALAAGKHVLSECLACHTLAEGVALIETVEKSGKIYMIAENYPYMLFNQEMRRIFQAGKVGEFMYGEGEYVHPGDADMWNSISIGKDHWRNWMPATYYCTHSLAPLMYITGTWPVKVSGFIIPRFKDDPATPRLAARNDAASVIMLQMNNGALVKLLQVHLRGHSVWSRVHGTRGQMENLRHGDEKMVRLRLEQYHAKHTEPPEQIYRPDFPILNDEAWKSGHGGGDFFTAYYFAEAIRSGKQPYLDVYRAVSMSIVGPLGYRSALDHSSQLEVPDFRDKKARRAYAKDHWSPAPENKGPGQPPPSIFGDIEPPPQAMAYAKKIWRKNGYTGE